MSSPTVRFDDVDWLNWVPNEEATLLFVVRDGSVLLIHKKRGLGAGKLNGPGGRLRAGEEPLQAAVREFEEELRVQPADVYKCGEVLFHVLDGTAIRIHVFKGADCIGEPRETAEALPLWTPVDAIPYDRMWADDRYWFPLMLADKPFEAHALFDGDELLAHEIVLRPDSGSE